MTSGSLPLPTCSTAVGIPDGQGYSDDHVGYGIAYPIQALDEMLKEQNKVHIDFMDFPFDD